MKVGFDYWQVLSHFPEEVATMIFALKEIGGNEVHIISAIGKQRIGTIAGEVYDALSRGGYNLEEGKDYQVHEVVFEHPRQSPELKVALAQQLGLDMFFDDRDDVSREMNKAGIMALRVTRKDNSTYDLGAERS